MLPGIWSLLSLQSRRGQPIKTFRHRSQWWTFKDILWTLGHWLIVVDLPISSMALFFASNSSSQPAMNGRETQVRVLFFPIYWNEAAVWYYWLIIFLLFLYYLQTMAPGPLQSWKCSRPIPLNGWCQYLLESGSPGEHWKATHWLCHKQMHQV